MATRAKELSDLGNLKLDVTANGIDVVGVGSNFKSESYNVLNLQTDTDDSGSSDDGIFKITNGAAGTTKAEFRWDESEDLVHVSYGDHGRHISINSAGNVGIGTGSSSPVYPLSAVTDVDSFVMKVENDGNSPGTSGASYADASDGLWVDTRWNTATNTPFKVTSNSGTSPLMIIKGDGKFGIGTDSPGYKLEVAGTAHVSNTLSAGALTIPSQGMAFNQAFGTGVPSITMTGTANNGRAGAINFKESDGSGGAIANTAAIYATDGVGGNSNYGGITIAAYQSDIRFSTATLGGTKMIVKAGGNVGIGTTDPSFTAVSGSTDQIGLEVQNGNNDSSAHLKLTGRNNTGTPGVATSLEIIHRGDALTTDFYHGGVKSISINSSNDLEIHNSGKGLKFTTGSNQRIYWNDHRALEGATDASVLQVGEGFTKILNQGHMVTKATSSNRYNFEVSASFTATGNSVTNHEINLNTLIGASTAGTLGYTVHVVGYGSGGTNGLNYTYTVGGYSGHNYSSQNFSSMGAGTIQNGYKSSNSTEYDARGISYHPCKNLGAYIANGEVYAYVPGPQRYGVTINNTTSNSFGCVMTIRGMYTG